MSSQPNLLFLITDQQRADTVMPGSLCQMPHLIRLAERGTRFENCYAPNPICAPVRASLFTGLLPHNHGMVDNPHAVEAYRANLKADLPFWSQELQRQGYQTAYFGKWHVERSLRLEDFGFAEYDTEQDAYRGYRGYRRQLGMPEETSAPQQVVQVEQPGYKPFILSGISPEPAEATLEHYIYERGIQFIQQHAPGQVPWALVLSTLAPHDPYIAPQTHYRRYDPSQIPPPASFDDTLESRPVIYRRIQQVWQSLDWEHFARATASYYAFCSLVDDQVGRILAALEETGQLENTLVVYVSDHGDYLGAHRLMLKGIPAFEQAYRVPLVLAGPGVPQGRIVAQRVSHLDLAASLLPLLGIEAAAETVGEIAGSGMGRSCLPLLGQGPQDRAAQAAWSSQHFAECHGQRFNYTQRILWWEQYKYVFNGFDLDEFYNLADDPHELHNRAHETSLRPLVEEMAARMWQVMRATGDANMVEAEYGMFRFAPLGPRAANRG
jgi:arylsulfatase A-like enzyme